MRITGTLSLVLTAAAALATLGGIGAATADSSSPATVCRATGTNNDLSYSNQGRISNPNSSDRYLICPLHRSTAYNERWVYVTARDRHYSRDISCTAFSTNDDGGSGWWGSESTSGSSTTYSTLTIDSRPYSYTFGTSYVRCTLPARYSGNNSSIARVATDKSL